jgi:hypothetical protein
MMYKEIVFYCVLPAIDPKSHLEVSHGDEVCGGQSNTPFLCFPPYEMAGLSSWL